MRSLQAVQNSKGETEYREIKRGMSLKNAVGDITDQSMGFQIVIDTMTFIKKQTIEQKFYEVEGGLTTYVPVEVGDGAFAESILTNLEFSSGGDFETGLINTGTAQDRLAQADASVASKRATIANWAKGVGYNVFEIELALSTNNWDPIAAKERARKKNWDLGLQNITFMGLKSDPTNFPGLLTSPVINVNTTLIQEPISTMDATEFNAFAGALVSAFFDNSNKTVKPDRLLIPQSDYFGLVSMTPNTIGMGEGNFPITRLAFLLQAFKLASQNPNFQILPLAYCDADLNADWGVDKQIYLLYKYDRDTVRMDIPVDYTITMANTLNGFQFQGAAYGQFTSPHFYANLQALQFEYTPGS